MVENQNGGAGGRDLNEAMADAVRAVEKRENPSRDRGADVEVELGSAESDVGDAPKSASEAVTESLLKAKHELESVLKQTQEEAQHLRDKWLRAAADLENYRKRAQKERDDVAKFGSERLLKDFLPMVDDLDRVVSSASGGQVAAQAVIDGAKLVSKKFVDQLEKHGVTTFESVGKPFDPNFHEAVQQVHSEHPMGTVVEQLQRGFTLHGRLLRPALVTVSLGPASSAR